MWVVNKKKKKKKKVVMWVMVAGLHIHVTCKSIFHVTCKYIFLLHFTKEITLSLSDDTKQYKFLSDKKIY